MVACADATTAIVDVEQRRSLADAQIRLVAGASQEGRVGSLLPEPLVVEVRDAEGAPFIGAPVEWVFRQGAGALPNVAGLLSDTVRASTDADGRAEIRWRLGTVAGQQEAAVAIVSSASAAPPSTVSGQAQGQGAGSGVEIVARAEPGAADSVLVAPEEVTLVEGDSVQLSAEVTDEFGNAVGGTSVEWASSDETVAIATQTGLVRTVGEGTAEITAMAGTAEGSVPLTSMSVVGAVGVSPSGVTMTVGDTMRFSAAAFDLDGDPLGGFSTTWTTSDSTILRIDDTGLTTGLMAGSASVTATVDGQSGSQHVTVRAPSVPRDPATVDDLEVVATTASSVTVRWTQVADGVGGVADYAVRYASPTISWGAAYPTEVTVEGTGVGLKVEYTWTGFTPGTDYEFQLISYRGTLNAGAVFGNQSNVASTTTPASGPVVVTVQVAPTGVSLLVGDTARFGATALDAAGNPLAGLGVSWASSDDAVLQVDATGLASGSSAGVASIVATIQGVSGSQPVTVQAPTVPQDPGTVGDLQVAATTASSVTLRWTQVSDGVGGPADYALRFGSPTLSWGSAGATEVTVQGAQVGATLEYTRTGLAATTDYQFQLVSYRGTPNVDAVYGARSTIVSVSTDYDVARVVASPDTVVFTSVKDTGRIVAHAENSVGGEVAGITLDFSSSSPTVVEVDPMGRLRAHSLGTAVIAVSAICCGDSDSVIVEVNGEADTLAITVTDPTSVLVEDLFLEVGETAELDAEALNAIGDALGEIDPQWSSSNGGVASVSSAGVVEALSVGNTNIVASINTSTGVLTATVPTTVVSPGTPPPSGLYPNQPSGMTVLTQWDGTSRAMPPGWVEHTGRWNSSVDVVQDLSNPLGTGHALQVNYGVGSTSAGIPLIDAFAGGPYDEIYIMYRIYYDPNWEAIGHKNFYWGANPNSRENSSGPSQYYATREANNGAKITVQNGTSVNITYSTSAWQNANGNWTNLEIHAVAESSPGADDGEVYYYHNGTLLGSNTNVSWVPSHVPEVGFNGFEWYTQRNGANTRPSWFRVGELYISGR